MKTIDSNNPKYSTRSGMGLTSKRVSLFLGNDEVTRGIMDAISNEKKGLHASFTVPAELLEKLKS
jgi:hypothetical protein